MQLLCCIGQSLQKMENPLGTWNYPRQRVNLILPNAWQRGTILALKIKKMEQENQITQEQMILNSILRPRNLLVSTEEEQFLTSWRQNGPQGIALTKKEADEVIEIATRIALNKAAQDKGLKHYEAIYSKVVKGSNQWPVYTSEEWMSVMMNLGAARAIDQNWRRGWVMDELNRPVYKALSMYFSSDPAFEKLDEDFSLRKGLLVIGGPGCGKTMIMQLNSINPKMCYSVHDCIEIANEYAKQKGDSGTEIIGKYSNPKATKTPSKYMGQEILTRFFDDLGAESTIKHFGNEKNVMSDIIQGIYKNFQKGFPAPHLTSNLTMPELTNYYEVRVSDRINEMCNIIIFPQRQSFRK